jgi:hypothetical protein
MMPDIDDIWDDEEDRQQITEAEKKERINALRQKIIDAEKALSGDTIQIPLAEYEKLKADAERYRWLREVDQNLFLRMAHYGWLALDAAIDDAIKQEGGA